MLPGMTLDARASDPVLIKKTPPIATRLGPQEMRLLAEMAVEFETTRSNLARRLLVERLVQLRGNVA